MRTAVSGRGHLKHNIKHKMSKVNKLGGFRARGDDRFSELSSVLKYETLQFLD